MISKPLGEATLSNQMLIRPLYLFHQHQFNIWGIGMAKTDKHIHNPARWKGENLLGFALMEVRDEVSQSKPLPVRNLNNKDE
jgi:hypothetical protein